MNSESQTKKRKPGFQRRPRLRGLAERNALVEQWSGLPAHVVRSRRGYPAVRRIGGVAEAVSAGMLGLIDAAELWDPAQGTPFPVYAFASIWGTIKRESYGAGVIRVPYWAACGGTRRYPLSPALAACVEQALACRGFPAHPRGARWEPAAPEEDLAGRLALLDLLETALSLLPARQRLVVDLRYCDGLTHEQIAPALGVTRQRVHQLEVLALGRLRRFLSRKGSGYSH